MFKICARTVLELGAELISSDLIAFYELVKNAFDAQSPNGAEIRFEIALRRNDYLKYRHRAIDRSVALQQLKSDLANALDASASPASLHAFRTTINAVSDLDAFVHALDDAYALGNRIIVSDEGTGAIAA